MNHQHGLLVGLDAVPWDQLNTAYGDATSLPSIVRGLASDELADVDAAWEAANEQGISHQGTVYSGTIAVIPYLAWVAGRAESRRRPRLISYLADLSLGGDEPYSPAGTAAAAREAVRSSKQVIDDCLTIPDRALRLAIAKFAAAFPFDLPAIGSTVKELAAAESDPAVRTALAGASVMLGDRSPHSLEALLETEHDSVMKGSRTSAGTVFIQISPSPHPDQAFEDVVTRPVYTKVMAWLNSTTYGVEDSLFFEAASYVGRLFWDGAEDVIWSAK